MLFCQPPKKNSGGMLVGGWREGLPKGQGAEQARLADGVLVGFSGDGTAEQAGCCASGNKNEGALPSTAKTRSRGRMAGGWREEAPASSGSGESVLFFGGQGGLRGLRRRDLAAGRSKLQTRLEIEVDMRTRSLKGTRFLRCRHDF